MPFFAWECISLQLKDGYDINLVIKNEENMKVFLKFLILKLKSFDGVRDTFKEAREANIRNKNKTDQQMMERVYNRYVLKKVQMKISFEACRQFKTIQELFLSAILKTYDQRNSHNLIPNPYPSITKK